MSDWAFVLTPLLVLPLVLLFRFVGCPDFGTTTAPVDAPVQKPPRYRDYIMGAPNNPGVVKNDKVVPNPADIIAYWRLVDAPADMVAKDEKGVLHGTYVETAPTNAVKPSEASQGKFFTGQNSLITSDPTVMCRIFAGGHVLVKADSRLYSDEFTIEAWVDPQWGVGSAGYEHTLFDVGGFYTAPFQTSPGFHGFRVYADADGRWQVTLRNGSLMNPAPKVPLGGRSHVAVTVQKDGGDTKVTIYVNGKPAAFGALGFYSKPEGATLFIGVGNATASPANPAVPVTTALSKIQEVVLYRKALSAEEIENHALINA